MTKTRTQKRIERLERDLWQRDAEIRKLKQENRRLANTKLWREEQIMRKEERLDALFRQDDIQRAEIQRLTEENFELRAELALWRDAHLYPDD